MEAPLFVRGVNPANCELQAEKIGQMSQKSKSMLQNFSRVIVAILMLTLILSATELFAFQFAFKKRGSHPYHPPHALKSPRSQSVSAWAKRSRPAPSFIRGRQVNFSTGYYALPFYWGNQYSGLSNSRISASDYPSNITGYDSEFRRGKVAPRVQAQDNVIAAEPSPATILNEHFLSQPQQVVNSHFALQQRLLESNETPLIQSATAASNLQGHAEKAFREGRYADAAYYSDAAVKADPYNGVMRLFCSQCNFAIGKYSVAILMLEQATTMLRESEWDYVAKNYDTFYGEDDYVMHTRALANYLKRRPDDNRARTLLGYHYGSLGYKTTASQLFHQSLQTYRNDELAQQLLPIFGDANYASTYVKEVQAPTPDLLEEPVVNYGMDVGVEGNRLIYLTPEATVSAAPVQSPEETIYSVPDQFEELPSPEETFFDDDSAEQSVLMPSLDSPQSR